MALRLLNHDFEGRVFGGKAMWVIECGWLGSCSSIRRQPRRHAEEGSVIESLEETPVLGIVVKSKYPPGIFAPEKEYPPIGVFIQKYPLAEAQIPKENDLLGAAFKEELPVVLVVENPGQKFHIVILIPGRG